MDYDFRNKIGGSQLPMHRPASSSSTPAASSGHHPMYGYPSIGQQTTGHSFARHHPTPSPPSSSPGTGIRVALKPEYRITPPPQLSPQTGDIPRSNFQFDFDFERKVLAEAEKERPDWSKLVHENISSRPAPAEIPSQEFRSTRLPHMSGESQYVYEPDEGYLDLFSNYLPIVA